MAIKLHEEALAFAKHLIEENEVVMDGKDNWSEDQPTTDQEDNYLKSQGIEMYGKWFLGINTEERVENKTRYEFPYGDFSKVHRGGVIAAKMRAGQYHHSDIEKAADYLLSLIDKNNEKKEY